MRLIIAACIGLIVGAVAKVLMPGKDPGGIIVTILLGIGGALLGTWIGRLLGFYGQGRPAGFIMSVIGAVIILWIYRRFAAKPAV